MQSNYELKWLGILANEKQYFFILGAIIIHFYAVSNLNNKVTNEGQKIF